MILLILFNKRIQAKAQKLGVDEYLVCSKWPDGGELTVLCHLSDTLLVKR